MAATAELAAVQLGAFLTDGHRLLQVAGGDGKAIVLEDCGLPCDLAEEFREEWTAAEVLERCVLVRRGFSESAGSSAG